MGRGSGRGFDQAARGRATRPRRRSGGSRGSRAGAASSTASSAITRNGPGGMPPRAARAAALPVAVSARSRAANGHGAGEPPRIRWTAEHIPRHQLAPRSPGQQRLAVHAFEFLTSGPPRWPAQPGVPPAVSPLRSGVSPRGRPHWWPLRRYSTYLPSLRVSTSRARPAASLRWALASWTLMSDWATRVYERVFPPGTATRPVPAGFRAGHGLADPGDLFVEVVLDVT